MMTDEEIEQRRAKLSDLIGPTRAEWYAEACKVGYDDEAGTILWACRYREMAVEAGRLEAENARLRDAAVMALARIESDIETDANKTHEGDALRIVIGESGASESGTGDA